MPSVLTFWSNEQRELVKCLLFGTFGQINNVNWSNAFCFGPFGQINNVNWSNTYTFGLLVKSSLGDEG